MPTDICLRDRLIKRVRNGAGPIARRSLAATFGTNRKQADDQIGWLLCEHVFILIGRGVRGDPELIQIGPKFPKDKCPCCMQSLPLRCYGLPAYHEAQPSEGEFINPEMRG